MGTSEMTVTIYQTPSGTVVKATGASTAPQRVEIVPGSVREGQVSLGSGTPVSGVVLTVRPV